MKLISSAFAILMIVCMLVIGLMAAPTTAPPGRKATVILKADPSANVFTMFSDELRQMGLNIGTPARSIDTATTDEREFRGTLAGVAPIELRQPVGFVINGTPAGSIENSQYINTTYERPPIFESSFNGLVPAIVIRR